MNKTQLGIIVLTILASIAAFLLIQSLFTVVSPINTKHLVLPQIQSEGTNGDPCQSAGKFSRLCNYTQPFYYTVTFWIILFIILELVILIGGVKVFKQTKQPIPFSIGSKLFVSFDVFIILITLILIVFFIFSI